MRLLLQKTSSQSRPPTQKNYFLRFHLFKLNAVKKFKDVENKASLRRKKWNWRIFTKHLQLQVFEQQQQLLSQQLVLQLSRTSWQRARSWIWKMSRCQHWTSFQRTTLLDSWIDSLEWSWPSLFVDGWPTCQSMKFFLCPFPYSKFFEKIIEWDIY